MKPYRVIVVFLFVILIIGCAAQNKMRYGIYTFTHDDKQYQIESFTPPEGSGNNFLVLKKGKEVILKAIDKGQNGYIDRILAGDITLSEARKIYSEGLQKCSQSGKIEKKFSEKSYRSEDISNEYFLATYNVNSDEIYNKFTIIRKLHMNRNEEYVFIDNNADGTLNEVIGGKTNIDQYQSAYKRILEQGVKFGRINNVEDKYIVKKSK